MSSDVARAVLFGLVALGVLLALVAMVRAKRGKRWSPAPEAMVVALLVFALAATISSPAYELDGPRVRHWQLDQGSAYFGLTFAIPFGVVWWFRARPPSCVQFEHRCMRCGYLLRGLPEPRCPECGMPFEREP